MITALRKYLLLAPAQTMTPSSSIRSVLPNLPSDLVNVSSPNTPGLRELQGRMEVFEDAILRLQDLEERVDFAERMLARQQHDERRLEQGS